MADANNKNTQQEADANAALLKRLEGLEKSIETLKKENAALQKRLSNTDKPSEEKPKPTIPDKVITVDGRKFRFTVPQFRYSGPVAVGAPVKGVLMTAEDAINDEAVLATLVSRGGATLKEVA